MCGIAGCFSTGIVPSREEICRMTDALAHRGPDASGIFLEGPVGLGHRRLSIIDLSEAANQPMSSSCGRYVMVYNGEVYNFMEILEELRGEGKAQNIKTTSDTEVLLEAFAAWGTDFVRRLNGMFAIAIYDKKEERLFIFRDRLGIKPLFYYYHDNYFAFASELKALERSEQVKRNLNLHKGAISYFLHLAYIPQPHTIWDKVFKFPAGNYAEFDRAGLRVKPYWLPKERISSGLITDETEAKEKLRELVLSSVRYRLISDVPYGTFLSGGTDSSLVTAVAQKVAPSSINTFSIGFPDSEYDESAYAARIAKYLGTIHHEFMLTEKDTLDMIPEILVSYDEPYADSSAIPTMLVSKLARQSVTMTLSGDGGDELFHGYGAYRWAGRLDNWLLHALRSPIAATLALGTDRYRRIAQLFRYDDKRNIRSHIFSQEQNLFSENEINNLLLPEFRTPLILERDFSALSRKLSAAEEQALFDIEYYLPDDLLVKTDRASMKYSLEVRVPLLDYRIVEFALNLSPQLKYKNGQAKYLLKQVLFDFIPAEFFNRPKWGFSIPLKRWLKNELRPLMQETLAQDVIKRHGIVDPAAVESCMNLYLNKGHDYLNNRLWILMVLHRFLETKHGRG